MEKAMHAVYDAAVWAMRAVAVTTIAATGTAVVVLVVFVARLLAMLGPLEDFWS